jgi:hypothetical protein
MSNHLSEDQFEAGLLGQAQLEHINGCSECREEFDRVRKALSLFRSAVWGLAEDRVDLQPSKVISPVHSSVRIPKWGWALAVATFVAAVVIPMLVPEMYPPKRVAQISPEAVMERLNRHLSRTVPEPMEPVMSLISTEPFVTETGGVQ